MFIDLSRGAALREIHHLEYFITRLLAEYFPGYASNRVARRLKDFDTPIPQQVAVIALIKAVDSGNLRRLLLTWCRPK